MPSLTTRYEEIDGVKKKVFVFRGDEAYAKTVDLKITNSTPVTTELKGFKVNLTGTVYRNVGDSSVDIYDGDEVIATVNLLNSSHSFTLSDMYFDYDVEHTIYGVYNGNDVTLKGKSKALKLYVEQPPVLNTNITFTSPTTQINKNGSLSVTANAKVGSSNVANGTTVYFLVDDVLKTSATTSSGNASATLTGISEGLHKITASVKKSEFMNPSSASYNVSVGYNIVFSDVPTILSTENNTVQVKFYDWFGELATNCSPVVDGVTYSGGTVNATKRWEYSDPYTVVASLGGSSKSKQIRIFTPTGISITTDDLVISNNIMGKYTVNVEGTGYNDYNIPISYSFNDGTVKTGSMRSGSFIIPYNGIKSGVVDLDINVGGFEESIEIYDAYQYFSSNRKYNLKYESLGDVSVNQSNIVIKSGQNGTFFILFNPAIEFPRQHQNQSNPNAKKTILEFDVLYTNRNTQPSTQTVYRFGFVETRGSDESIQFIVANNDHVKIVANDNALYGYVNDELKASKSITQLNQGVTRSWFIESANTTLQLTNLKIV